MKTDTLDFKYCFFLILLCLAFYLPGIKAMPPVDRDEARFAQATRQMVESGDYVRINFQDQARNKKPIGIYWLQAASVVLSGTAGSREIWPHRVPSLLGAMAAVLFTFGIGRRLFDRKTAFLGAAFCAGSLLLTIEAHLAKTDAVMLATIAASQLGLSRYYVRPDPDTPVGPGAFWLFWGGQALGILIKGPIPPMVSLLTILGLFAADRNLKWLKGIRPLRGLLLVAAVASPWLIAIGVATKGAFYQGALGKDLFSKVASGQESHGFPPGYYLLLVWATFWPASSFLVPGLWRAWKLRSSPAVRFCLAWIVPVWLVFELVPTKLPHYVLPTWPALALLAAAAVVSASAQPGAEPREKLVRLGFIPYSLVVLCLGFGLSAIPYLLEGRITPLTLVPAAASVLAAAVMTGQSLKSRFISAAGVAVAGSWLVLAPAFQFVVPGTDALWLSRSVASAVHRIGHQGGSDPPVASAGYHEPSLVFLLGTRTVLTSPSGVAQILKENPRALALVSGREEQAFRRETVRLGLEVAVLESIEGVNYSHGKKTALKLYGVMPGQSVGLR